MADTLYSKIVAVDASLSFDDDNESEEDYKDRVLRYFDAIEDGPVFDALDSEIQTWVSECVDVSHLNETSRKKKALPGIGGLTEPPEDDEEEGVEEDADDDDDADDDTDEDEPEETVVAVKAKRGRPATVKTEKAKKPAKVKAEKAPKVKKEPKAKKEPKGRDETANRYYRAWVLLSANPKISTAEQMRDAAAKKGWTYSDVTAGRMLECSAAVALAMKNTQSEEYEAIFG